MRILQMSLSWISPHLINPPRMSLMSPCRRSPRTPRKRTAETSGHAKHCAWYDASSAFRKKRRPVQWLNGCYLASR